MKIQISKYWDRIRSSLWFIPLIMTGVAVVLAFTMVDLDASVSRDLENTLGLGIFTVGAEGARTLLGAIAGSMITIAGVVFSMVLVALSLVSSQLGPRLLRNFMRDTTTQVVLGMFIATFLYCLLVLRTIHHANGVVFVPHLSVSLGVILAVVSVVVLIYFIHHVSVSLQVNEVVGKINLELIEGIDQLFPEMIKEKLHSPNQLAEKAFFKVFKHEVSRISMSGDGYIQLVDVDDLLALAIEEGLVIRLERLPGHFVVAEQAVVMVWSNGRVTDQIQARIRSAFTLGHQRTPRQDLECAISQLVEIAVRALSPGLNDPFTAITCIDYIGAALSRLAQREIPSSYRYDKQRQLRLIVPAITFSEVIDTAFNQIRQYGSSSVSVTVRLLDTIGVITKLTRRAEDLMALQRHADMIARGAYQGVPEIEDRRVVAERHNVVNQLLSAQRKEGESWPNKQ